MSAESSARLTATFGLLRRRGHEFLGESRPPAHVELRYSGTAILGTLDFGHARHRVVVKPTGLNAGVKSPTELVHALNVLASSHPIIACGLPKILAVDEAAQLLVMTHVDGSPLNDGIERTLKQ